MTCLLAFFLSGLLIAAPKDTNARTTPIALTVTLTEEQDAQRMLDALEKTDARITFFLGGEGIEPEQAHRITEGGHELALTIHRREQLGGLLSRRNMAAQILTARSGLPPRVKPHWLRLEEGLTGGSYQVAKAKNLAILDESDGTLRGGCVMDLGSASVAEGLVTVSELARLNRVKVRPGRVYDGHLRQNTTSRPLTALADCAQTAMDSPLD